MLEIAYARYKDPGYAWVLSLPPTRNAPGWLGRFPWGVYRTVPWRAAAGASHPAASAQRRVSWAGIRHATRGCVAEFLDERRVGGDGDAGQSSGARAQRFLQPGAARQRPVALSG